MSKLFKNIFIAFKLIEWQVGPQTVVLLSIQFNTLLLENPILLSLNKNPKFVFLYSFLKLE